MYAHNACVSLNHYVLDTLLNLTLVVKPSIISLDNHIVYLVDCLLIYGVGPFKDCHTIPLKKVDPPLVSPLASISQMILSCINNVGVMPIINRSIFPISTLHLDPANVMVSPIIPLALGRDEPWVAG